MKKCKYCGEKIQDSAHKCRYCGEWLNNEKLENNSNEIVGVINNNVVKKNHNNSNFFMNLFKGRLKRLDYFLFIILLFFVGILLNTVFFLVTPSLTEEVSEVLFFVVIIFNLIVFGLLYISGIVRRFHDLEMSEFWFFILFVPVVNIIFHLILLFKGGTDGTNRYGSINESTGFFKRVLNIK